MSNARSEKRLIALKGAAASPVEARAHKQTPPRQLPETRVGFMVDYHATLAVTKVTSEGSTQVFLESKLREVAGYSAEVATIVEERRTRPKKTIVLRHVPWQALS